MSWSLFNARRIVRLLSLVLTLSIPGTAAAEESWGSPLLGRELIIIQKTEPGDPSPARPLPPVIRESLGPDAVEYEAFVATRLPAAAAQALTRLALREGRGVQKDTRPPVVLPFHRFHPEETGQRTAPWTGHRLRPVPVPGLYLIRFAFPLRSEWTDALRACGADPVLYYGNGVFLTRARNLGMIRSCQPAARHLSWVDSFRVTDRTAPDLLDAAGLDLAPYSLVFAPGTSLETALAELPSVVESGDSMTWQDGTLSLGIRAGAPELEALLQTSLHLLAILPPEGEPELADERQGQIVAGNYHGYPTAVSGAVTATGYLTWLANRGLRSPASQHTVAVFDSGYDDGTPPSGSHHPLLENPERLFPAESMGNYVFNPHTPEIEDLNGHGTFVSCILAGDATAAGAQGTRDAQNFQLGTGIAPDVNLVAVQVTDSATNCDRKTGFGEPPTNIANAITFSRVTANGSDKALIANHSWNVASNTYTTMAKLFDERVIDGAPEVASRQPMIMVVAAGNEGTLGKDRVLSPATAKNVITVGSTQSYRPSTEAGAPPNSCSISFPSAFTQEADNIAKVSAFSSQGADFRPYSLPVVPPLVTGVRVKPDLVAPGGRVASCIPYLSSTYPCQGLCQKSWPAWGHHSYASGTSFAAPVVTGSAAHLRTWFLDRGADPAPSLVKAALIATATDLGAAHGGDHRPSYRFGWGRVDLNRATDPAVPRVYVNENPSRTLVTGSEWFIQVTHDNANLPTAIVLVWSDPASSFSNFVSQVPLVNDLHLTVETIGLNLSWHGNNLNEVISGVDDGFSHAYTLGGEPFLNDTMNNVEAVFIPRRVLDPSQRLLIRVTGANVHSSQNFSLYVYNAR